MHACVCTKLLQLCPIFVTPWTRARQSPLSMGFSKQEYWSELPCPPPGNLLDPGIEPVSLMSPALASKFSTTSTTWEAPNNMHNGILNDRVRKILINMLTHFKQSFCSCIACTMYNDEKCMWKQNFLSIIHVELYNRNVIE